MNIFRSAFAFILLALLSTSLVASDYEAVDPNEDGDVPCCVRCCASSVGLSKALFGYGKTEEPFYFCCESSTPLCCWANMAAGVASLACLVSGAFAGCITSNYHCNNPILKYSMGIPCGMPAAYCVPVVSTALYCSCGMKCAEFTGNRDFSARVQEYELEYYKKFDRLHQSFDEQNCTNLSLHGPEQCNKCLKIILKPCCGTAHSDDAQSER